MADYEALSFDDDGRISVDVCALVASPEFQRVKAQIEALREWLAETLPVKRTEP